MWILSALWLFKQNSTKQKSESQVFSSQNNLIWVLDQKSEWLEQISSLKVQEDNIKSENERLHSISDFVEEIRKNEKLYIDMCLTEPYLLAERWDDKLYLWYYRDYLATNGIELKFWIYQWYRNSNINKELDVNDPKRYFKLFSYDNQLSSNHYENDKLCKYFKIKNWSELKNRLDDCKEKLSVHDVDQNSHNKISPLKIQQDNIKAENERLHSISNFIEEIRKNEDSYSDQCKIEPYLLSEKWSLKLYLWYYRDYLPLKNPKLKFWIYQWYIDDGIEKDLAIDDPNRYFRIHSFSDQLSSNHYENDKLCKVFDIKDKNHLQQLIETSISHREQEKSVWAVVVEE
jgi:hypothetical protein